MERTEPILRRTTQHLMPAEYDPPGPGRYDIYPGFPLGEGRIGLGFDALAERLARESVVILDGYVGVLWSDFRERLDRELRARGVGAQWIDVSQAMLGEDRIEQIVQPFLGGSDPLFGTRFTGSLRDFFDASRLAALRPDPAAPLTILYGCGAHLANWKGALVYLDVPKNEIQFRSRAGAVCNLGQAEPRPPKEQYKRFYFVDWVALNRHKSDLLPQIDLLVDAQRPQEPSFTEGDTLRDALARMGHGVFRTRPWFEPGPWGGQWIREKIPGLAENVPNYAWSFELLIPENGLILSSGRRLLEVSSDLLLFHDCAAVLGSFGERFGFEFPIRFDFLDTFAGGNLSIQCHPRPGYIRRNFGEVFTQDESYYILDCKPGARVHLGFREGVNPGEFRAALERSVRESVEVDIPKFVNVEVASKHDLLLIPGGTIHGSGRNNLVLEISSTPYIFTFKMYDWMRMDLDGTPRALNIDRAFENLYFERQGETVKRELVSRPRPLAEGPGWRRVHLPTHPEHFYDVHRFEFSTAVEVRTEGSVHVLSLVEGEAVLVETASEMRRRIHYAETFAIPAAAESYRLVSEDGRPVKVVMAFLKPEGRYPL